jgi:SAM-dependent methyltransferase
MTIVTHSPSQFIFFKKKTAPLPAAPAPMSTRGVKVPVVEGGRPSYSRAAMEPQDNTARFSGKATYYALYRPTYPSALLDHLRDACGLLPRHVVADIGSGTGKLSRLFLSNGNTVLCVEPNVDMRTAAEELLSAERGFQSIAGSAEATGLDARSADMVAVGQAFHWFDAPRAREEFRRILRPGGYVVLVWNARSREGSAFLGAYEDFLREFSVGYTGTAGGLRPAMREEEGVRDFFSSDYGHAAFPNPRVQDFPSVWGGYLSASYAYAPGHPRFDEARERLRRLFDEHQRDGVVSMPLSTEVHHGRI